MVEFWDCGVVAVYYAKEKINIIKYFILFCFVKANLCWQKVA
jgi:hypothetical protein